jgi:lipopolysaccharide/colanic/teichoic acid biosynthesis glycosyltransferase
VLKRTRPKGSHARRPERVRSTAFRAAKRGIDLAVSLVALTALSPLLILVCALVKLTSRGPILFVDEREGLNGRVFRCFKFRTMRRNAHDLQRQLYKTNEVDGPQFKMKRDPRITPIGHLLRRSNIDELPQLLNVLAGQMSLVGPRPSPFRENQICVPWRNARLSVKPGITGLWQLCRHDREISDFHQWIYYDTLYVQHQSISLDLRILLGTLLTFGGRFSMPLGWVMPSERQCSTRHVPDAPLGLELAQRV